MKSLFLKFLVIILLFNGCSNKDEKISIIEEKDIEFQMIDAYKKGIIALEEGDVLFAVKNFNEAELLFPQSQWAPKSSLMAAYSYYSQNYYGEAIDEIERFLKTYPNNESISYAHFLIAMCYYETIIDERKDLEPLIKAKELFTFVVDNYPVSDFAMDAEFKLELIEDILASKEMYVGKHYIKKEKWIAAINRFKVVINEYDTTVYAEEALHRLVEVHYKIGLIGEAKKYAKVLGYNYESSQWYKQSYRIFNKNYEDPLLEVKKEKEGFIKRKFLRLFK
jgi:outer membrane protein assembly factor BamD